MVRDGIGDVRQLLDILDPVVWEAAGVSLGHDCLEQMEGARVNEWTILK